MTQYNSLKVKLSNSQINELKSAIKDETEVVLRLSSNMIGDNYYYLTDKFQIFVNLLQIIHHPILGYQKLSCPR